MKIEAVEKHLGFALKEQPDLTELMKHRSQNTFARDAEGHVTGLNLRTNKLTDKKIAFLQEMPHLQALNLSENELMEIRFPTGMRALRFLDLSENPALRSVVFEKGLPHLEMLDANECALETLDFPAGFGKLQKVELRKNALARLNLDGGFPALTWMDVSQNKLTELRLPAGFPALRFLYLNDNLLQHLVFAAPLRRLQVLHLRKNQLKELPANFWQFSNLETLYLHGNPLPNIPKGASGMPEGERDNAAAAIRNYMRSISEDNAIPNDEVKLVLLGNSTAGKSSLLHFLKENDYDETLPSTHGIQNFIWEPKELDFKVNVWDFGGQEFYHATHRLFLSDNAISVVVFEQATNEQGEKNMLIKLYENGVLVEREMSVEIFPFTYWLDNLQYFCRGEQVTDLVQTKMDIAESVDIPDSVKKKYRLPADTARISVKATHTGEKAAARKFEDFREELFKCLKKAIAKYPFSEKWLLIKNDLRDLPETDKMLDYDAYVKFCEERREGISKMEPGASTSMLDTLTDYLHETGVILRYRDHEDLRNTVFVRPQWVIDTIYKVLDLNVMESGGKFDRAHIAQVASDFDTDQLIALMRKFELIFPVNNEDSTFVAPQYLPNNDPKAMGGFYKKLADKCGHLLFALRFPHFLPRSVMTRFMCKYGPLARDNYWKNGILFDKDNTWILVEREGNFDIIVRADVPPPMLARELFDTFRDICRDNSDILVSANGTDFVKIGYLLDPPEIGDDLKDDPKVVPTIQAENGKWVKITDFAALMGERMSKSGETTPAPPSDSSPALRKLKVFISYAHKEDSRYMKLFVEGIKPHSDWEIFDARQILIGQDWHERLQKEIKECDFGIMLISPWFFQSEYIKKHEFEQFVKKNAESGFPFFGMLLVDCDFKKWEEISKRQLFVAHGQDYGLAKNYRDQQISFDQLVRFDHDGEVLPSPDRNAFCKNFVAAVNTSLIST